MMAAHSGSGWQMIMADLALILFMVSISAAGANDAAPSVESSLVQAEPTAIYRPGAGASSMTEWLAGQPADPRQMLTITGRYSSDGADMASADALKLAAEARSAGRQPRIVLEAGPRDDLVAVLAFDDAQAAWHDTCSDKAKGRAAPAGQREFACD